MISNPSILGTGWSYPPTFELATRRVAMVSEQADVQQSLEILLSTRPGELTMEPDFGCNLDIMLFESITTTLLTEVKELIQNAILYHEPRIEVKRININTIQVLEGLILIEVDYFIRSYNSRFNLVYPFYLNEGGQANRL